MRDFISNRRGLGRLPLIFLFASLLLLWSGRQAEALTAQIAPEQIGINLLYHGGKLTVSGAGEAGDDFIVKITAPDGASHLKYKGKAAGIFWMKLGKITFEHIPALYKVFSSNKLATILKAEDQDANRLGYASLAKQVEISAEHMTPDKKRWFAELIRFKEKDNLYTVQEGTMTRSHTPDKSTFSMEIDWPYQARPGVYSVEVLAVRDGHVVDKKEKSLTVRQVGLVKQLTGLAFDRAALYGVIAVVIALVSGFAVGAVFKGGGGH